MRPKKNDPYAGTAESIGKLVDTSPELFSPQSKKDRLANKSKMSSDEFKEVLKSTFKLKDKIRVIPPKSPENSSSKFSAYAFDSDEFGPAKIILSAGEAGNKGNVYEADMVERLRIAVGPEPKEDPIAEEVLRSIGAEDTKSMSPDDIEATGKSDTRRKLSFDGPQYVGDKISDMTVTYRGRPKYISLKNVQGHVVYNGGTVPGIEYLEEKNKVTLDQGQYGSRPFTKRVLDALNVDPNRIVHGLNKYVTESGEVGSYEPQLGVDVDSVQKLLGSAVGYGYYYVKQTKEGGVSAVDLTSKESVEKFIGSVDAVSIKYPDKKSKSTVVRVDLVPPSKGALADFKSALIELRDTRGGVAKPEIKIKLM